MTIHSADELVAALEKTYLIEPAALAEVRTALAQQSSDPRDVAKTLVHQGRLTLYQADQLLDGRAETLLVGGYRILEPLGEGGMGQVFKAEQCRLNRLVALKVIHKNCLSAGPDSVRRFQREALAAAQLSHPNVITIYDAGLDGETHFIVMEFVEGMDLGRLVERLGPLPVGVASNFISQAALGLQHAHERGMVHRDIKPSNLLVTRAPTGAIRPTLAPSAGQNLPSQQEPGTADRALQLLEGGVVKILDMGLALLTEPIDGRAASALTEEGKIVGTPDYIAPEQARSSRLADGRADIYSLGCTFYFLLCGRTPFPEGSFVEKLLMHQLDAPEPLERVRPVIPSFVAAIVAKMMAKRPEDRYQTALEVFGALTAFAGGTDARAVAPVVPSRNEPLPGPRRSSVTPVRPRPAISLVPESGAVSPDPSRYNSWTGFKEGDGGHTIVKPGRELAALKGHKGCVIALAFSPDRNTLVSAGVDQMARVWDFTQKPASARAILPTPGEEVSTLLFAADKKTLVGGTNKGRLWLWDMTGPVPQLWVVVQAHSLAVTALACSADGRSLASGGVDHEVHLWDLEAENLRLRTTLPGLPGEVTAVAFAPDGKRVATGSQDGTVRLWTPRWMWNHSLAGVRIAPCAVSSVIFAPNGGALACGSLDQTVHLLTVGEEEMQQQSWSARTTGRVRLVQMPADGQTLVTVEEKGQKCVYDIQSGAMLQVCPVPVSHVYSYALTFDARYLATGNSDGKVVIYRVAPKREKA